MGLLGLFIVIAWGLIALLAPIISPQGPFAQSDSYLHPPSFEHLAGTDHLGRDVFDRIIWGTRVSLVFAFGVAGISIILGLLLGAIPGYAGGIVDLIFSRSTEIFLVIPRLLLLILASAVFGVDILLTMVLVGLIIWPTNAKITRAQVLTLKYRVFVKASVASGSGHTKILFSHILPNGIYPVIANSALEMGFAIILEASLSFLGLGDPNHSSWGQIIYNGRFYIGSWWLTLFPGLTITSLVIGFNFIGDGINYVLNPKFKQRKISTHK